MRIFRGAIARVVVIVVAAAALFAVQQSPARAGAAIVTTNAYCAVNHASLTTDSDCPIDSRTLVGRARAVAETDFEAGKFELGASASPHWLGVGDRWAFGIAEFRTGAMRSPGGHVQVVLDDLRGRSTTVCREVCDALATASAYTMVTVSLLFHGENRDSQTAFCPVSFENEVAPERFVVPDDCSYVEATLEVPPDSTFEVIVHLVAQASARGGAAASSSLAGRVREIRVP